MTYIEKEKQLLEAIKKDGYSQWDGDAQQAGNDIADFLSNFPEYANIVIREQIMYPIWQANDDQETFKDHVMNLDSLRKSAHDCAIDSVNILNRLMKRYNLPPFSRVDTNDRQAVANFVAQFINETYQLGIGKSSDQMTLDDVAYDRQNPYDKSEINRQVNDMMEF